MRVLGGRIGGSRPPRRVWWRGLAKENVSISTAIRLCPAPAARVPVCAVATRRGVILLRNGNFKAAATARLQATFISLAREGQDAWRLASEAGEAICFFLIGGSVPISSIIRPRSKV